MLCGAYAINICNVIIMESYDLKLSRSELQETFGFSSSNIVTNNIILQETSRHFGVWI